MRTIIIVEKADLYAKPELHSKIIELSDQVSDNAESKHFFVTKEKLLNCLGLLLEYNVPHRIDFSG